MRLTTLAHTEGAAVANELWLDADGGCVRQINAAESHTLEVIRDQDEAWLRLGETFWLSAERGIDAAREYADVYHHGTTADPDVAAGLSECVLAEAFQDLDFEREPGTTATYALGPDTRHNGVPVRSLTVDQAAPEGTRQLTLLVAAEGEPYPPYATGKMISTV